MRLWSVHPQHLDVRGLVALWREGLLARKVLLGETNGQPEFHQASSDVCGGSRTKSSVGKSGRRSETP